MSATILPPGTVPGEQVSRRQSIVALAGVEAGRMVRHPAFVVSLAVTLIVIGLRSQQDPLLAVEAWGFAWMGMLVAAAFVAGRQCFLSQPDLFPATPVSPGDRVLATALALIAPTFVAGTAAALVALAKVRDGGLVVGDEPYTRAVVPAVAVWAEPVLVVALVGVVGILVAHLPRGRLAVLGILVFFIFVGGAGIWLFQDHPFRVVHPFMYPAYEAEMPASFSADLWVPGDAPLNAPDEYNRTWREIRFDTAALNWHLLYIGGLILLGVWIATRLADRDERSVPTRWLVLVGLPLLLAGGVAQIVTAGANP